MTDSPEDLRHILRACMPGPDSCFVPNATAKPDFHAISAYARLGHKYQIDHLLNQALDYLKGIYTDDFDKWINMPASDFDPLSDSDSKTSISVVNIAHLTGCPSILPAALAVCCSLEESVLDGFPREDGTFDRPDAADLYRCIKATREIKVASTAANLRVLLAYSKAAETGPGQACMTAQACSASLSKLTKCLHKRALWLAAALPFRPTLFANNERTLCAECRRALQEQILEGRRKIWMRLPKLLDIEVGGWGVRE
ncbi:hypothetical protein C8Q80DRAFT_907570 [Daedaleopsis nitida]|nr:hypothetical protein C8Q80DRAFT_907570 [Daedaleopsis nitida]